MKKLICLLLAAAVFATCLCGCAASDKPAETAPAATPEALATPEPEAVKWTDDNLKESVYGFLGKDLSEDVYADELRCFTSVFILSDQVLFFNQPPFWDMMPDRPGVYTYGDCVYTETAAVNLDCLKYFPNLESLWVALCDVKNTDFLAEMPRLKYLALCGCGIEDISVLAECDNLREITMHDNSISDLSPLADMELWDLFMSYNSISDISPLAEMEKLRNIYEDIRKKARSVDMTKCTGCGACMEKCPSKKTPSEFNRGLNNRSAIYTPFAQAIPNVPVIDRDACIYFKTGKCGVC